MSPRFHEKELIFFSQGLRNVRAERDDEKLCCPSQQTPGEREAMGVANELKACLSVMPLLYWQSSLSDPDFLYLSVSALRKGRVSGFSLHWLPENRNINSIFIILIMLLIYSIKAGFLFFLIRSYFSFLRNLQIYQSVSRRRGTGCIVHKKMNSP